VTILGVLGKVEQKKMVSGIGMKNEMKKLKPYSNWRYWRSLRRKKTLLNIQSTYFELT
jgi:hypothetical protein